MIERDGGQIELHCDCGCGAVSGPPWHGDEFRAMLNDAKANGWKVERVNGEWTHHAPDCQPQRALI